MNAESRNAWSLAPPANIDVSGSESSAPSRPSSTSKTTVDPTPDPVRVSDDLTRLSRSQDHASAITSSSGQQNDGPLAKENNFSPFRNLHDDVCRRWQLDCDKWNDIFTELESQKLASEEGTDGKFERVKSRKLLCTKGGFLFELKTGKF